MRNPVRALFNWFRLESELVDVEKKQWYAYLYKG